MKKDQNNKEELDYYRGGGSLFGDPESKPKNSYRCPKHGIIPSAEIDWQETVAYCPNCGQKLEISTINRTKRQ